MIIEAKGIEKSFGSLKVLKGVDFQAEKSEVVSIMGASGAGKSTLLQILGTLSSPDLWFLDAGHYRYASIIRRRYVYLCQHCPLFDAFADTEDLFSKKTA